MQKIYTPWGKAQQVQKIADGIVRYDTASHGGYKISECRRAMMPEPYKSQETFTGGNWYEEDCDWCLLVLSFPKDFSNVPPYKGSTILQQAQQTYNFFIGKEKNQNEIRSILP